MPINNSQNTPQPAQQQQAAPPQVQQQPAQPAQQPQFQSATTSSFQAKPAMTQEANIPSAHTGTLHGRRRMGYSTSQTSGLAGEMIKLFDEKMKSPPNDGASYELVVLNAGNSGLKLSAIVVVATPDPSTTTLPKEKRKILAHHTLLLSATAPADPIKVQHRNDWAKNRPVERSLYSFDGYDEQMKTVISQQLAIRFPGYQQLSAEASEVPRAISAEDKTTLNDLMSNATRAAGTVLVFEGTQELSDFSLADLTQPNGDKALLGVEISTSFAHVRGLNGYPVRGDIVMSVHESLARKGDDNQASFNSPDAQNRLCRIMGFLDLQWTGASQNMMAMGNPMLGGQAAMPHYTPQFVITDVSTEITETLPALFLALTSVQSLADNGRWKEMLIRQHVEGAAHLIGGGTMNMRDLGAIGYEVTQPGQQWNPMMLGAEQQVKQPFPTTSGVNHDYNLLNWLVNTYIAAPALPVSIDIAEAGTSTWVTSVLLQAALGNPKANELIVGALNLLTNGGFSAAYNAHPMTQGGQAPIMINNNLFVNLGYWHDDNYGDRDIRDLDYLSHLVLTGKSDPEAQSNWHSLHSNTQIDPWLRLEKVTDIQKSIFMNLNITGRAARVTFNPVALFVLAQVIAGQGFVFDIKDSAANSQGITRIVAPWLQSMNVNLGSSNAFQTRHTTRAPGQVNGYGQGVTNMGRY